MGANLNTGIRISGSMDQTDNGITEKYCYRDLESNCSLYGGLYQWAELVQYLNGATNTDSWSPVPEGKVRGICPEGWHIPDETDWAVFSMNLGGDAIAGGLIKETDTLHWMAPNTGASNLSGFTSLPAGVRKSSGNFNAMGLNTWYWSATQASPVSAWYRSLSNTSETFYAFTSPWQKSTGISVRCLKDN
jgi:uncharacterized protein (TIGR02145 family)